MEENISLYVYDQTHKLVANIDAYETLIWSDRFNKCGDFELTLPYEYVHKYFEKYLVQDNYCGIDYSKRKMIIEKIEYKNEEDSPPTVIVSGRSIECILERRIVITKTDFGDGSVSVSLQNGIKSLLNTNVINPSVAKRRIPNFVFNESDDPEITSLYFTESYNGADILKIISDVCDDKNVGFRLIFDENWNMIFELYLGKHRTMDQSENVPVVFSPSYDTLKNSNYFTSIETYKNMMYVSIDETTYISVFLDSENEPSGLERREVHIDSEDLSENKKSNLTENQIREKAKKVLKEDHKKQTAIEGEIVPNVLYEYGTDYDVGDRVNLTDIYGNSQVVRITEVVITCDATGLSIIPTFEEI